MKKTKLKFFCAILALVMMLLPMSVAAMEYDYNIEEYDYGTEEYIVENNEYNYSDTHDMIDIQREGGEEASQIVCCIDCNHDYYAIVPHQGPCGAPWAGSFCGLPLTWENHASGWMRFSHIVGGRTCVFEERRIDNRFRCTRNHILHVSTMFEQRGHTCGFTWA